jgi:hypothetical protein
MELVLIAFLGTLALMFAEMRDSVRRRYEPAYSTPVHRAAHDPSVFKAGLRPEATEVQSYSEAA